MTQEFHISVTPIRDNEYLVRTEQVAPGVPLAEEQLVWPIDNWLDQARHLMNDPLIGLLQGDRVTRLAQSLGTPEADASSASVLSLIELGQALYSQLFQGRLRDSWLTAQGIAQHRGEVLRLRLGLKGDMLPRLPWEVLNGGLHEGFSGSTRPLSTGTDILFSRYQPGTGMMGAIAYPPAPKPQQTLRILMAIAAPDDQERLKLKQEASHLQQELRLQPEALKNGMIGRFPDIQVTILEQPGRAELAQALEQGHHHIFHFAGHSDLGLSGGQIYLVNRQTGLSEPMSGDDLAGLLVNNDVQMAVFNSCRGAYTATTAAMSDQGDRSLTEALVSRGIPAVLAMAEQIPDDVALTLTRLFYRNLKQDYPVDLSLSRARQGLLSAYSSHQLYWALPILYMHAEFDGYLTAGDRTLDNPADALIRLPHLYAPPHAESVHPFASNPTASSPPTQPEPLEPLTSDDFDLQSSEDVTETTYLEPRDAPVIGDDPDLPDDFFLGDDDLAAFSEDLDEDLNNYLGSESALDSSNELDSSLIGNSEEVPKSTLIDGSGSDVGGEPDSDLADDEASMLNLVEQLSQDVPHSVKTESGGSHPDGSRSVDEDHLLEAVPSNNSETGESAPASGSNQGLSSRRDEPTESTDSAIARVEATTAETGDTRSSSDLPNSQSSKEATSGIIVEANAHRDKSASPNGTVHASNSSATRSRQRHLAIVRSEHRLSTKSSEAAEAAVIENRPSSWRSLGHKVILLPLAGVAGAAVVVLGYQVLPDLRPFDSNVEVSIAPDDLPEAPTDQIIQLATSSFEKNDLQSGQAAVEELFRRERLDQVSTALEAVPDEQINEPLVNFLQGRLAWENANYGDGSSSIRDASQFWTYAAQKADTSLYHNALGFALYSEGRTRDALNAWQAALESLESQGFAVFPESSTETSMGINVPAGTLDHPDAQTAYAGIALALAQLSAVPIAEQPFDVLSKALQIQQVVIQSGFSPESSNDTWLWTDAMVREWEILKGVQSQ